MLNLNVTPAITRPLASSLVQSRANFAQALNAIFANLHHYPNGQLLCHSAGWFNIHNAPGPLQPSEDVKWQLLCVAKSFFNEDRKPQFHPELNIAGLPPEDLALLYRMVMSFFLAESQAGRYDWDASTLCRHHLALIEDYVSATCQNNTNYAQDLRRSILAMEDPKNLNGLLQRITIAQQWSISHDSQITMIANLPSPQPFDIRWQFYVYRKEFQTRCHKSLFERMAHTLSSFSFRSADELRFSFPQSNNRDEFVTVLWSLCEKIREGKMQYSGDDLPTIRARNNAIFKDLKQLLRSSTYQENKDTNLPQILFLQELCFNLYTLTNTPIKAHEEMKRFTDQVASLSHEEAPGTFTDMKQVGSYLRRIVKFSSEAGFNHNSDPAKNYHLSNHEDYYRHADTLGNAMHPIEEYDPFLAGNVTCPFGQITLAKNGQEHKVHHILAGTPTLGFRIHPFTYGFLDAARKKGVHFLDANVQAPFWVEEKRGQALVGLNQNPRYQGTVSVHSDTVDTETFHKGKGLLTSSALGDETYEPGAFHTNFSRYLGNAHIKYDSSGYYFSNQAHLWSALESTRNLMTRVSHQIPLSHEDKSRLHQFCFQIIKNSGEMIAKAITHKNVVYIEHCKEDIDRGAIKNVISSLIFRFLGSQGPISKDELHAIISPVLTRAQLVANRAIYQSRLDMLLQLMDHIPMQGLLLAAHEHFSRIGYEGYLMNFKQN